MPLHLLGKKSWNVYNTDNVERVRRDEADARAREEAAEQLMQEQDAARRIALLRGEEPPAFEPIALDRADEAHGPRRREDKDEARGRKRKRLKGEDETDREMRYAREDAEVGERAREALQGGEKARKGNEAPLQNENGHIQLVPVPREREERKTKMTREERSDLRKKEDEERQGQGMRFSDAAGYRKETGKPWYAASDNLGRGDGRSANEIMLAELQGRDVWGNEDPGRKEREQRRITSNDPFAMMQQAQKQLKRSEDDKEKWHKEREREMRDLEKEQERKRRRDRKHEARHSRRRGEEPDELEGFSLDGPSRESRTSRDDCDRDRDHDGHRRHRHSRRHRSRERSRSRSRERRRRRDG